MNRSKLIKYAEGADLMNISISYGKDIFDFNLYQETVVNENKINSEIKKQPSAYAFLGMLHKKLIRVSQDKKREMEKAYASAFVRIKKEIDPGTNRPIANDLAKEKAQKAQKHQEAIQEYLEAQHNCDIIEVCVKAFEQRVSLIQTLSANIRKEK